MGHPKAHFSTQGRFKEKVGLQTPSLPLVFKNLKIIRPSSSKKTKILRKYLFWESFFINILESHCQSPRGQKPSFFSDSPWNSVWLIFFEPIIRVLGRAKVDKVYSKGDFEKSGLKSSFLSFIYRESVQMVRTKISIRF